MDEKRLPALPETLAVEALCSGFGRYGGQVAQVIAFTAIGDGLEVFGISPVGDADTSNLALFCHDSPPQFIFFFNLTNVRSFSQCFVAESVAEFFLNS